MPILDYSAAPVEIPCGNCGNKIKATFGGLKRDHKIRCGKCGQIVEVDLRQFDAGMGAIEKRLGKMRPK